MDAMNTAAIVDAYTTATGSWSCRDWDTTATEEAYQADLTACRCMVEVDEWKEECEGDAADDSDREQLALAAAKAAATDKKAKALAELADEEAGAIVILAIAAELAAAEAMAEIEGDGDLEIALALANEATTAETEAGGCAPAWQPLVSAIEAAIEAEPDPLDEDWADSRETSLPVARAIWVHCDGDASRAQAVWGDPDANTQDEIMACAWASTDADTLCWGEESFNRPE